MPNKSRRGRGRHPAHMKKKQLATAPPARVTPPAAAAMTPAPSPAAPVSRPQAAVPAMPTGAGQYAYVTHELKRIFLLAGIALAALLIVALVWR